MSKLVYGVLGASVLVAVVSLASRVIEAQTLPGSSGSCISGYCPPPDCSQAAASPNPIWPPDHKMVQVNITPVPNAAYITIVQIWQDEPVETPGSGNTEPDGSGVGTSTAYVRAERAGTQRPFLPDQLGPGTGRIYFISFTGNGPGGSCIGVAQACVPHDQGQRSACIDTGMRWDSTKLVD